MNPQNKALLSTHLKLIRAHLKQSAAIARKEQSAAIARKEGDKAHGMQLRAKAALAILGGEPLDGLAIKNLIRFQNR